MPGYHTNLWRSGKVFASQLAVYAGKDFSAPGPVTAEVSDEMEGAVSNLIDTHGLTLLSWHQARQGDGQTLMMEGSFSSILSWLNDWQKACPHGSVKVIEWCRQANRQSLRSKYTAPREHR